MSLKIPQLPYPFHRLSPAMSHAKPTRGVILSLQPK
jgi:hypothetical protein